MKISDETGPGSRKKLKVSDRTRIPSSGPRKLSKSRIGQEPTKFWKIESVLAGRSRDLTVRWFLIHKTCKQFERLSQLWKLSRDGGYFFVKPWLWLNMGRLSCLVMSDLFIWKQMRTWMMICTRTSSIRNIFGDFEILRFFESFEYFSKTLTFIFLIRLKNTQIRLQIIVK